MAGERFRLPRARRRYVVVLQALHDAELDGLAGGDVEDLGWRTTGLVVRRGLVGTDIAHAYPELISFKICSFAGSSYRISSPSSTVNPSRQNVR